MLAQVVYMFCRPHSFNKYLPVQHHGHGFCWLIQQFFCESAVIVQRQGSFKIAVMPTFWILISEKKVCIPTLETKRSRCGEFLVTNDGVHHHLLDSTNKILRQIQNLGITAILKLPCLSPILIFSFDSVRKSYQCAYIIHQLHAPSLSWFS